MLNRSSAVDGNRSLKHDINTIGVALEYLEGSSLKGDIPQAKDLLDYAIQMQQKLQQKRQAQTSNSNVDNSNNAGNILSIILVTNSSTSTLKALSSLVGRQQQQGKASFSVIHLHAVMLSDRDEHLASLASLAKVFNGASALQSQDASPSTTTTTTTTLTVQNGTSTIAATKTTTVPAAGTMTSLASLMCLGGTNTEKMQMLLVGGHLDPTVGEHVGVKDLVTGAELAALEAFAVTNPGAVL